MTESYVCKDCKTDLPWTYVFFLEDDAFCKSCHDLRVLKKSPEKKPKPQPRKIIQIAVTNKHVKESKDLVYCLCNDGTVWVDASDGWKIQPPIPQEKEIK